MPDRTVSLDSSAAPDRGQSQSSCQRWQSVWTLQLSQTGVSLDDYGCLRWWSISTHLLRLMAFSLDSAVSDREQSRLVGRPRRVGGSLDSLAVPDRLGGRLDSLAIPDGGGAAFWSCQLFQTAGVSLDDSGCLRWWSVLTHLLPVMAFSLDLSAVPDGGLPRLVGSPQHRERSVGCAVSALLKLSCAV